MSEFIHLVYNGDKKADGNCTGLIGSPVVIICGRQNYIVSAKLIGNVDYHYAIWPWHWQCNQHLLYIDTFKQKNLYIASLIKGKYIPNKPIYQLFIYIVVLLEMEWYSVWSPRFLLVLAINVFLFHCNLIVQCIIY